MHPTKPWLVYRLTNTVMRKAYIGVTALPLHGILCRLRSARAVSEHSPLRWALNHFSDTAWTVELVYECASDSIAYESAADLAARNKTMWPHGFNLHIPGGGRRGKLRGPVEPKPPRVTTRIKEIRRYPEHLQRLLAA